ncbi:MAG: hypothetical protein H7228_15025 [Polaromonas sp.]|nr:hypothetical protein [Polaromonas sp.]
MKTLAVLAVLGAEPDVISQGQSGNLDELRRERAQSTMRKLSSALGGAADHPQRRPKDGQVHQRSDDE